VIGLTTAATIWLVAALGMGLADGQYALALSVTGITLLVLWGFPALERWSAGSATSAMSARTKSCTASSQTSITPWSSCFEAAGCGSFASAQSTSGSRLVSTWRVTGSPASHEQPIQHMLADPDIEEFRF